ncbi:MAG: acyl carrier protein [Actinomycetota bacterium]
MINNRIREFIVSDLNWTGNGAELTDDYPLLEKRVLDSVGILNLVSFVEEEFGVQVEDTEIVPQNFGTIASIAALVTSKSG